jgi:hypothetical protein
MSIEQIRNDVHSETITFGPHLVERMYENGISVDQVLNVILNGTVRKNPMNVQEASSPNTPFVRDTLQ